MNDQAPSGNNTERAFTATPATTESNGRDGRGRFAHGNNIAKKKKSRFSQRQALQNMALYAIDRTSALRIMSALVKRAEAGDMEAARIVLDFIKD